MKKRLFVGLGNPGEKYALTRHNLGYLTVQAFAEQQRWLLKLDKAMEAYKSKGEINGVEVYLLLPVTYMNESGRAVQRAMREWKISLNEILVVVDDVALPFENLRVRPYGSSGGHNGLKSIEAHLRTQSFGRLKMGIGQNPPFQPLADYVLGTFTTEECKQLPQFIQKGTDVLTLSTSVEIAQVMNAMNTNKYFRPQKESQGE